MRRVFLSIIIPVYNVEVYLRQCFDSILEIKFKEYEMILVTSDSTDKSNEICAEYQSLHSHITVVRQDGKGLSNARNNGLRCAAGQYVMYVDSDDFVKSDALDKTLTKLRDSQPAEYDVLISDFYLVDNNDVIYLCRNQIEETEDMITDYHYLPKFLSGRHNYWNVWRYIYRREFLLSNHLFSKENYKSEDVDYSTRVILKAGSIVFYHNPYYCYRIRRTGSLVNVITLQNIENLMEILAENIERVVRNSGFPYKQNVIRPLLREYIFSMASLYDVKPEEREPACRAVEMQRKLLKYSKSGTFIFYLTGFVGIRRFACLLYIIRSKKRKKQTQML